MSLHLLGTENAKTTKGEAQGVLTGILYLTPHKSEHDTANLCRGASPGCSSKTSGCLAYGWRGMTKTVRAAQDRKRALYLADRAEFMRQVVSDIETLMRRAAREGKRLAIRLNGTSDIDYTMAHPVVRDGVAFDSVFAAFPLVTFYDYSKRPNILGRQLPPNYDVTFSRSETNEETARQALEGGKRVAVVFHTRKGSPLPPTWNGELVLDGDLTDLRFTEPDGAVIGLRAKGPAKRDTTGFVVAA